MSSDSFGGGGFITNYRVTTDFVAADVTPGAEFDVPIRLHNLSSVPLLGTMSFTIESSSTDFQYLSITPGPSATAAGKSVVVTSTTSVNTYVQVNSTNTIPMQDGVIATIRYKVKPTPAKIGGSSLRLWNFGAQSADSPPSFILTGFEHGGVSLSPSSYKDVNLDGVIDVVDVQLTVNLILAISSASYMRQGDTNNDNSVDVVDVQTIVNCILAIGGCQ